MKQQLLSVPVIFLGHETGAIEATGHKILSVEG